MAVSGSEFNRTAPHRPGPPWALCRGGFQPGAKCLSKAKTAYYSASASRIEVAPSHGLMRRKPVQHFDAPPYKICGDRYSERDLDQLYRPFTF